MMRTPSILIALALAAPAVVLSADYDLGALARGDGIELVNRTLDPSKAGAPEAVYLGAAANDGLAWIAGLELGEGVIQIEIKGKDQRGRSFVGVAFHGTDGDTFDAVYLRPFNFQDPERRSHSIQYISMPGHDWRTLRENHPGEYEAALTPAPDPASWVRLKLVVKGGTVTAFVNESDTAALTVELLSDRPAGKVGLWVGNGSDGWFRNLRVTPSTK